MIRCPLSEVNATDKFLQKFYDTNLLYKFSLVRQKKPAKTSAFEEEEEQAFKLKKQTIFDIPINPQGVHPGANFVTQKRPRYSRY
jgi:hypothetical protein